MTRQLVEQFELTEKKAVKIAKIMPTSFEELREFTSDWEEKIPDERLKEMIKILKSDNETLLPILVNAPNFENRRKATYGDNKSSEIDLLEFKYSVLQNLVRSLYQASWRDGIIEGIDIGKIDVDKLSSSSKDHQQRGIANSLRGIKYSLKEYMSKENKKSLTAENIALKNKISYLFRRAVASEVKTQENLKELVLDKFIHEKEITAKADLSLVSKAMAISVPSALAAAFLLPYTGINDAVAKILPVVVSITPPGLAASWQIKRTTTTQTEAEKDASIYYLYDYDLSTLQSELEDTIDKLRENHYKVVFVIDELDKLTENKVQSTIESLKSLLNQASALFVLVTGNEFYDLILRAREAREKQYTLFSQKIFLRRPQFAEIKKFMDNIVDRTTETHIIRLFAWDDLQEPTPIEKILQGKKGSIYNELLKIFKNIVNGLVFSKDMEHDTIKVSYSENGSNTEKSYNVLIKRDDTKKDAVLRIPSRTNSKIIEKYEFSVTKVDGTSFVYIRTSGYREFQYYAAFASKSDFFDLYNVLRDHIEYEPNDDRPRLRIALDNKQITQAKLQEIMEEPFWQEQYGSPSEWHKNDRLLTLVYNLLTQLVELRGSATRIRIERTPFKIVFFNDNNPKDILAEVPDDKFYEFYKNVI